MTDAEIIKALEDNEIKKSLKCCREEDCYGCPYLFKDECTNYLTGDALDLINRQKAEIEKCVNTLCKKEDMMQLIAEERQQYYDELQTARAEIERLNKEISTFDVFYFCSYSGCEAVSNECWETCPNSVYNKTRAEAIKEFAERLKKEMYAERGFSVCPDDTIDNLVKEMVGENNAKR